MGIKYQALKGMEDILPGEIEKWQWLEKETRDYFESSGFREIRTPLLEYTELFTRSVGEASDIVHKEMFSFEDRGGRNITLRPEMTASVARAVIEHGLLSQAKSLRLYYIGPMFRAERPQAGRKRQFHQIGVEIINEAGLNSEAEALTKLYFFLKSIGIEKPHFRLNDLGDLENQNKMAAALSTYFSKQKSLLCKDCEWRLEKNVLRIFDCKVSSCQPVIDNVSWDQIAPVSNNFKSIIESTEKYGISYKVDRRLVRGLDYYNGIVFEVTAPGLGAQDALAGGGRYDRLYSDLGGKFTPCIGFSIGVERLITALESSESNFKEKISKNSIYFVPIIMDSKDTPNKNAQKIYEQVAEAIYQLGKLGLRTIRGDEKLKLADHLKKADKLNVRYIVILGPDEYEKKVWKVKNMKSKEEQDVKNGSLFFHLKGIDAL